MKKLATIDNWQPNFCKRSDTPSMLWVALVSMGFSVAASAAERTVGPIGDFRSIQQAVNASGPGDIITVRAGTYPEAVRFRQSGQPGKPIVLRAYPGERPIIKPPLGSHAVTICSDKWREKQDIGWINVEGFEMVGNATAVKIIEIVSVHHVEIRNNYLHDGGHQGILGSGHDVIIDGNEIARCGNTENNQNHGMYLTGRRYTITNNIVHDNSSFAIQAAAYNCAGSCPNIEYSGVVDWLIANNVFAFEVNRSGITLWIPDKGNYGERGGGAMSDVRVENNVFFENGNSYAYTINGIYFPDRESIHINNNIFYSAAGKGALSAKGAVNGKANYAEVKDNLEIDPKFVGASSRNFRLTSKSPALRRGRNLFASGVLKDFERKGRPTSGAFDVGAYQATAVAPTKTPSAPGQFDVE